jgi:hypothetical protein
LNESAATLEQRDLSSTIQQLKTYQASRKFKGAAKALMAINRMTALTKASNAEASAEAPNPEETKPSAAEEDSGEEGTTVAPTEPQTPTEEST